MHQIVLDPEEDYLDAKNLLQLIDRWYVALDVEPITLTGYKDKMVYFVDWWQKSGPAREWRLTKSALEEFEVYLRSVKSKRFKEPLSHNTRFAIMRALRMMFRWASETNRTAKNFGEWVPWPGGSTPARRATTPAQLAKLMTAALESRYSIRDQAVIAFFIGTGCRLCEVASLTVENVQLMADGAGTAVVVGKRTKHNPDGVRAVAFDAATGKYLVRYLDWMKLTSGPLWINENNLPLGAPGIYRMIRRTVKRAGLLGQIRGCHDLRRAFATILGKMHPDNPAWADLIRRQLGHKHYAMTTVYTLLDADDIRERIVTPLALSGQKVEFDD